MKHTHYREDKVALEDKEYGAEQSRCQSPGYHEGLGFVKGDEKSDRDESEEDKVSLDYCHYGEMRLDVYVRLIGVERLVNKRADYDCNEDENYRYGLGGRKAFRYLGQRERHEKVGDIYGDYVYEHINIIFNHRKGAFIVIIHRLPSLHQKRYKIYYLYDIT